MINTEKNIDDCTKICAKFLIEIEKNQSLALIENALWSMNSIVASDERMTKKNKANFDLLFKVTIPRIEKLMKIMSEDDTLSRKQMKV